MSYARNPYRDAPLWEQTATTNDDSAFRHLRITPEKAAALREIRALLSDIPTGSRVMVLGAHPWIYFATNSRADTDMIFMHTDERAIAEELLSARLLSRRPEWIVKAGDVADAVETTFEALVRTGPYRCDDRPAGDALANAQQQIQTQYRMLPVITVCRLAAQ